MDIKTIERALVIAFRGGSNFPKGISMRSDVLKVNGIGIIRIFKDQSTFRVGDNIHRVVPRGNYHILGNDIPYDFEYHQVCTYTPTLWT